MRLTNSRCHIDTINSPDDGYMAAPKMYRIQINIHEKEMCVKLVVYKDYTEMHGQQNIKVVTSMYVEKGIYTVYIEFSMPGNPGQIPKYVIRYVTQYHVF
jgi:hypothetical protein